MTALFTSKGFIESSTAQCKDGQTIDLSSVPPFLRVLLSTDGTVTKSLESYFWEPVRVKQLYQDYLSLDEAIPNIDKGPGERVMRRHVMLVGEHSQRVYVEAVSHICPETIPEGLRQQLEQRQLGVGELLRNCGLETYREILDIGLERRIIAEKSVECVWRTYRIVLGHKPVMQIQEYFPLRLYQDRPD